MSILDKFNKLLASAFEPLDNKMAELAKRKAEAEKEQINRVIAEQEQARGGMKGAEEALSVNASNAEPPPTVPKVESKPESASPPPAQQQEQRAARYRATDSEGATIIAGESMDDPIRAARRQLKLARTLPRKFARAIMLASGFVFILMYQTRLMLWATGETPVIWGGDAAQWVSMICVGALALFVGTLVWAKSARTFKFEWRETLSQTIPMWLVALPVLMVLGMICLFFTEGILNGLREIYFAELNEPHVMEVKALLALAFVIFAVVGLALPFVAPLAGASLVLMNIDEWYDQELVFICPRQRGPTPRQEPTPPPTPKPPHDIDY